MLNQHMSANERVFVSSEIKDLLISGTIEKCAYTPRCLSGLKVVPKKGSDKFRLITDLRRLNDDVRSSKLPV